MMLIICGAIATIASALGAVVKWIVKPLNEMSEKMKKIDDLEQGQKVMGKALSQMMEHTISGNNIEALTKEYHEMRDYFINH